ncbi:hypothetical protein QOZ80_9BG0711210 [Eleusine coracana subsp. coracana]|nr:hypothetical protein QOZ80_9BG0711210 [Eleusine coracana subsp. coracana]
MAVVGASATCFFLLSSWLCLCSNARLSPPPESNATAADELALLSFKSLLNSFNGSLDSWNTSSHFCSWPGIACGHRHPDRVVALRVPEFNLSGRISPSLGNLSFLRELDLRDNLLIGEIPPELGRLGRLELLNLSTNALVSGIPPAIAECANLVILVLSKNQLHGEIPASLGAMENLYILDLQENHLSGEIPLSLANLPSIEYLFLYSNMLSGEIPPELGNLTGLRHLDLMDNMLSGAIPSSLGKLSNLIWLSLGYNSLIGQIPASIWNISYLWGIDIQWNNLTGAIPANAFSKLSKLRAVSMDNNLFHGPLPPSLGNASRLQLLQLAPNSFSGIIPPQIGRLRNMTKLLLSNTAWSSRSWRLGVHDGTGKLLPATNFGPDCQGNDFKAIVYDFMANGSLEDWLHPKADDQTEQKYLNLIERVTILLDVAHALNYLHCHGPTPIVHCDLKSSNVLLDADMVAHVGDFGLAKILVDRSSPSEQSTSSMGIRGTIGYAAPEYGAGNVVSTYGDIYSYGILVLETVTGKRPSASEFLGGRSLREYVEVALHNRVMDAVDTRLSTDLQNVLDTVAGSSYKKTIDSVVSLLRLGVSCTQELPSSRMPTAGVIKELHVIKETLLSESKA